MNRYLSAYPVRHALSVGFAVLIAVIINYYFSYSKEAWIIITTFLVSQTTRGTPLKQGLNYVFIIVLVAIVLSTNSMQLMRDRIIDALIGGVLGIMFGQLVFPVKPYAEFCQGVIPILRVLIEYSSALSRYFLEHPANKGLLLEKKWEIEAALTAKQNMYPEWVYEVGFNPGLRSGFRFFLINLERVTEVFFSLNYLAGLGMDASLLAEFSSYMNNVVQKNEELLRAIMEYFSENKLNNTESDADFTSDMEELEKALNRLVPGSLDLLDISSDYVILTAFVRDLKDMRGLLLQLVMALPVPVA